MRGRIYFDCAICTGKKRMIGYDWCKPTKGSCSRTNQPTEAGDVHPSQPCTARTECFAWDVKKILKLARCGSYSLGVCHLPSILGFVCGYESSIVAGTANQRAERVA